MEMLFGRQLSEAIYLDYNHMDRIEDHLYLGDVKAATSSQTLHANGIKYVLSVLGTKLTEQQDPSATYLQISVEDNTKEDLLSHFSMAFDFIRNAQESAVGVLVHCQAGFSRSATVVTAYLMYKYRMPYEEAFQLVRRKRIVGPNEGFVDQLKWFESLGYTIRADNKKLRQWVLNNNLKTRHWILYKDELNFDRYFQVLEMVERNTDHLDKGSHYKCANCGQSLFNEINIIKRSPLDMNEIDEEDDDGVNRVYIEPQKWMKNNDFNVYSIQCPKCRHCLNPKHPKVVKMGCRVADGSNYRICFRLNTYVIRRAIN